MIIIVGAGLAGLTCAKQLVEAGQQVLVLESADQVGGRLRTDVHEDGYRLDRGFQVLFTAYPTVERHLKLDALKIRRFDPGAILVKDGKRYEIADPLRQPKNMLAGLVNPLISTADKLRVLRLRMQLAHLSAGEIFSGKGQPGEQDESTESYLKRLGFNERGFIDNFARPFYGGIFLERSLATSARMFQFTFHMLSEGETIIPAEGIQRVPEQLAAKLPKGSVRCNTRVSELLISNGRVSGVRLSTGEKIQADQVVVATSYPEAVRLGAIQAPTQSSTSIEPKGSICLYFAGEEQLYTQRKILLNANADAYVNNAVLLTNIAPTYAPVRKHLLSVTVLDGAGDDEQIAQRSLKDIASWFPEHNLSHWKLLAVYRIPFSQFTQPPGIYDQLPDNTTSIEGLYLAGEYTKSSSIQGAMHSGEHAARTIKQVLVTV